MNDVLYKKYKTYRAQQQQENKPYISWPSWELYNKEEKMTELETLQTRLNSILESNAHWKSCQDGSYEMALHNSGYWETVEKIKELTGNVNTVKIQS